MEKLFKRMLSLLVVLTMVISMVPNVFAAGIDFGDIDETEVVLADITSFEAQANYGYLWTTEANGLLSFEIPEDSGLTVTLKPANGEEMPSVDGKVSLYVAKNVEVFIDVQGEDGAKAIVTGTFEENAAPEGQCWQSDELKAHIEQTVAAVDPTCTKTGLTDGVKCSACGEWITEQKEISALGHKYQEEVTEPDCENGGYTTYTCSVCDDQYTDNETEPAGHKPAAAVKENEVAATCTKEGSYDMVVYCSVCKEEQSRESFTIPVKDHEAGETVQENVVNATCTVAGSYENVVYCKNCKAEMSRVKVTGETAPHTPGEVVKEKEVAATCTTEGSYDNVTYCTECDKELSRNTVKVPAKGHTEGEAVVEKEVAATCTTDGSYDTVVYCTVCKAEVSRVTTTVPATGHTAGEVKKENNIPATCTTDGSYDNVTYCSVCEGAIKTEHVVVPALGHTAGEVKEENVVNATCTVAGSYDKVTYCAVCKTEIDREKVTGVTLPHTKGAAATENEVAATCTADGSYDSVVKCVDCGFEISRNTIKVPATGHTEGEAVTENEVAATCTTDGSYDTVIYCTVCKAEVSRETTTVPATGHISSKVEVKSPTCTENGYLLVTCFRCDETFDSREEGFAKDYLASMPYYKLDATGHTEGEAVTEKEVAATCTTDGSYDNVTYCTKCNKELSRETITVDALGHTEGEAVTENEVAATCIADGSYDTVIYCTVCKVEVSRETTTVPATGHTEVEIAPVKPTFDNVGYTAGTKCSVCGAILEAPVEIPALTAVAMIGDERFETLQAAINEATKGDTITMLADVALGSTTVVIKKDLTLDLNGFVISGVDNDGVEASLFEIVNAVTLNIYDNSEGGTGKITYAKGTHNIGDTIQVNGTLNLYSGTLEMTGDGWNIAQIVDVRPNSWGNEYTEGSVFHMYGGKLISSDCAIRLGSSSAAGHKNVSSTFIMDGGEIVSGWDAIYLQQSNSTWASLTLRINDGVITGANAPVRILSFDDPAAYVDATRKAMIIDLAGGEFYYTGATTAWVVEEILRVSIFGGDIDEAGVIAECEITVADEMNVTEAYHIIDNKVGVHAYADATCTAPATCICGVTKGEALGHKYESAVTAPTCTAEGYTTYTCSVCNDTYVADKVAALDHAWDDGVYTEPTYEADGFTTYTCTVCGETKVETDQGSTKVHIVITSQPDEEIIAKQGDEVALTVVATGGNATLKYNWYKQGSTGDWFLTGMEGQGTATLTVPAVKYNDVKYYCEVTDGEEIVATSEIKITIETFSITDQTTEATTILGTDVELSVTVTSTTPVTYRWLKSNDGQTGWYETNMTGFDTGTLIVDAVKDNDVWYRCKVTNGSQIELSEPVKVTYQQIAVIQPEAASAPETKTVELTTGLTGITEGITYRWLKSNDGETGWYETTIQGCDTATLTVPVVKYNDVWYRCEMIYAGQVFTTEPVKVSIAALAIKTQPTGVTQAVNTTAELRVEVENATENVTYRWLKSNNGETNWYATTMCTGDPVLNVPVVLYNDVWYRCEITDGSQKVITEPVKVSIQEFSIKIQPESASVAVNTTAELSVEIEGAYGEVTYRWFKQGSNGSYYGTSIEGWNTNTLKVPAVKYNDVSYYCEISCGGIKLTTDIVTITLAE